MYKKYLLQNHDVKVTNKIDIWAFGMILYELFTKGDFILD